MKRKKQLFYFVSEHNMIFLYLNVKFMNISAINVRFRFQPSSSIIRVAW